MAYKVMLPERKCQQTGCANKAGYDVLNNRNSFVGEYCVGHAVTKVETLSRMEKELAEAQKN